MAGEGSDQFRAASVRDVLPRTFSTEGRSLWQRLLRPASETIRTEYGDDARQATRVHLSRVLGPR